MMKEVRHSVVYFNKINVFAAAKFVLRTLRTRHCGVCK